MDDLISEFITETSENLQLLDSELVKLEHDPNNAKILRTIFRLVHTIKGTCGFLGLPRLEAVAHASEDVLGKIRDAVIPVTPQAISLVLESLDAIKIIIEHLSGKEEEPAGSDADLIARLNAFAQSDGVVASVPVTATSIKPESAASFKEAVASTPSTIAEFAVPPFSAPMVASNPAEIARKAKEMAIAEGLATEPTEREAGGSTSQQSIRVNLDVLDSLMQTVGELVLTRNQLMQMARTRMDHPFASSLQQLSHITSELQEGIMKTRMQPIGNAWSKFPRLLRDLSHELDKKIELRMSGEQTELDRQLLELIKDPLTHMVRNSADHGIEMPQERRAAGKSETGTVSLSAFHEGGHIIIEISDDGRGLNIERIKQKIVSNGLASETQLASLSEQQIMQFIFRPGFSTAEKITSVSGRGVGMDVVRSNIEKIGGTVELSSVFGKGSKFNIRIPLTLAIISVLIVEAAGERFALPQINIQEIVRVGMGSVHNIDHINNASVLRLRDTLLPLVALADVLKLAHTISDKDIFIAVCKVGGYSFGLVIDRVFDIEEIVVKPMSAALKHIGLYAGTTILGDGKVIMILDPNGLAHATGEIDIISTPDAVADIKRAIAYSNMTSYLLFKAEGETPKAVPLELVWRIEEIDMARAEFSGGSVVLQYHNDLMRLHSVPGSTQALPTSGKREVIVFSYDRQLFGLVVDAIIDIVSADYEIKVHSPRPGFLGSMIVEGKATDVVDVAYLLAGNATSETRGAARVSEDKCKLLFVEDSPFFRELTVPFLSAAGYKVTAVGSAIDAMRLLEISAAFDVVISDIEMPEMDGYAFAHWCRSQPQLSHIPVLAFSASKSEYTIAKSQKAGFRNLIAKTDRITLLQSIADALHHHERQKA